MIRIGPTEESILKVISEHIAEKLSSVGVFNRVFSRIKSVSSIERKITLRREDYIQKGKKMQDVFGIRITVYFLDDEKIAEKLIKSIFQEVPDAHSIDSVGKDRFGPMRHNLVFKIDSDISATSNLFDQEFIDSTFEVQFRTVFSEGWHEVEHDLRYKCKSDWDFENDLNRQLNGQLAGLETSEWAMLKIFDELAYKKYKSKEWNSFFRNVLRLRFEDTELSTEIVNVLNKQPLIAKEFIRMDREDLIFPLAKLTRVIPLKMDNVILTINHAVFKNEQLMEQENGLLKKILEDSF